MSIWSSWLVELFKSTLYLLAFYLLVILVIERKVLNIFLFSFILDSFYWYIFDVTNLLLDEISHLLLISSSIFFSDSVVFT